MEEIRDSLATVEIRVVGWTGLAHPMIRLFIDGECVGVLKDKREKSFRLTPGVRNVMVKCMGSRSESLDLSLSAGEVASLECGFHQWANLRFHLTNFICMTMPMFMGILDLPYLAYTFLSFSVVAMGCLGWWAFIIPGNYLYLRPPSSLLLPGAIRPRASRLPRMTIRKGMIAVALTAVLLAIAVQEMAMQHRAEYETLRKLHRFQAELHADSESFWKEIDARRAAYYAGLKEKYLQAASRPWEPVAPDPPPP